MPWRIFLWWALVLLSCGTPQAGDAATGPDAPDAALPGARHPTGSLGIRLLLSQSPRGVAIAPDDVAYVTQSEGGVVALIHTRQVRLLDTVTVGVLPTALAVHPTRLTVFVSNSGSNSVGVLDINAGVQRSTVALADGPLQLGTSPDGTRLYVTTEGGRLLAFDAATSALVGELAGFTAPSGLAVHPGAPFVYVADRERGQVTEVRTDSGLWETRALPVGGRPQGLALRPDGQELFVADETGWLTVVELSTGAPLSQQPLGGGGLQVALSPDGRQAYVSVPDRGQVAVFDAQSHQLLSALRTGGRPQAIAFDALGRVAAVTNADGWVDLVR